MNANRDLFKKVLLIEQEFIGLSDVNALITFKGCAAQVPCKEQAISFAFYVPLSGQCRVFHSVHAPEKFQENLT